MNQAHTAHICVIQPGAETSALACLDHALDLKRALHALGVEASIGKNRFKADRINLVLGAHLGADPQALRDHPCILINLERLGPGAPEPSPHYLSLLRSHVVVDIDPRHGQAYLPEGQAPHLIRLTASPQTSRVPLAQRSIGLLYQGPVNQRTAPILAQIEQAGITIAKLDDAIQGPERHAIIENARAVLRLLDSDEASFDVAAAAPVWWAGTPVVAERPVHMPSDPAYHETIHWFSRDKVGTFFDAFNSDGFVERSRHMLDALCHPAERTDLSALMALAQTVVAEHRGTPLPTRLNADLRANAHAQGWLNVGPHRADVPDVLMDLGTAANLPSALSKRTGSFDQMHGGALVPGSDSAATLLGHAMNLLKPEGVIMIKVPGRALQASSLDAGQAVRDSLMDATKRFWRSGWLTHRFEVSHIGWLDANGLPLNDAAASELGGQRSLSSVTARVVLRKVETTYPERATARACSEDFALE